MVECEIRIKKILIGHRWAQNIGYWDARCGKPEEGIGHRIRTCSAPKKTYYCWQFFLRLVWSLHIIIISSNAFYYLTISACSFFMYHYSKNCLDFLYMYICIYLHIFAYMYVYINIYSYMFIKAESFLLLPFFFFKKMYYGDSRR